MEKLKELKRIVKDVVMGLSWPSIQIVGTVANVC
jgi:hypothetical protein